jgi:hypothetical protein
MKTPLRSGLITLLMVPLVASAAGPVDGMAIARLPADTEYFQSSLRLGETVAIIGQSNAWKLIMADPAVMELRKKLLNDYASDKFEWLRSFLEEPENAKIPAMLADAMSQEFFLAAGPGTGSFAQLLQELSGTMRFGGAFQQLQGGNRNDPKAGIRMLLKLLAEKPERIRIPDFTVGYKVTDAAEFGKQIARLEGILNDLLKETPLKGKLEWKDLGGKFLTLPLDGSMVPWDKIEWEEFEENEGEFKPLVKHLKGMKLTISMGVKDGYLLFNIGAVHDGVANFGGKGASLATRPELKPMVDAAGPAMMSMSYTSAALRQAVATTAEDILGMTELVKQFLPYAMLPDDINQGIEKDVDAYAQRMIQGLITPKAAFAYSLRTARGWESFSRDLTPSSDTTVAKPLTLLQHLGGAPILAGVWRSGGGEQEYKDQIKGIVAISGHAEKIIRAKLPDAEPMLDKVRESIYPLLQEMDRTTQKLWLPALADGQSAIVIDAKWTSAQFHKALPKMEKPMPLPQIGIVMGVSDAAKMTAALSEYRATANKLIQEIRNMAPPDAMPEFEIPAPETEEKSATRFAWYALPGQWGFDPQLQPTGGVAGPVAALALSREYVERLMKSTDLAMKHAPLADRAKAMDGVVIINTESFAAAVEPWIAFAIQAADAPERKDAERIAALALKVLKCFPGYCSATWRESGVTVTHSEMILRDVMK